MMDGKVEAVDKITGIVHYAKGQQTDIPQIDKTLTKEGQCADAKAVGDAIKNVKNQLSVEITNLRNEVGLEIEEIANLLGGDA